MISRRNIREKVMQTLYTLSATSSTEDTVNRKIAASLLDDKFNRTLDLFVLSIAYTFSIAKYASKDAANRAGKYLPTQEDKNVSTKIAANEFLLKIESEPAYQAKYKDAKIDSIVDDVWVKKLYQQLYTTPEYAEYISSSERNPKSEKAILNFIWKQLIAGNKNNEEDVYDYLPNWEVEKNVICLLMENLFRDPALINFQALLSEEKREYAHSLLFTVIDKAAYCKELIHPKLINWDAERIAQIDLLLLRMGICELLYFPTIPTRVTINEYIEIAKAYSTPQSGQFINGVLDSILKDLEKENKIKKQERPVKK